MPRRARVIRRTIAPDPVFSNRHAGKFINNLMYNGKKSLAERIFYSALEILGERSKRNSIEVFEQALTKRYSCSRSEAETGRRLDVSGSGGN